MSTAFMIAGEGEKNDAYHWVTSKGADRFPRNLPAGSADVVRADKGSSQEHGEGSEAKRSGPAVSAIKTPLVFEPNKGQADPAFQWIGRGAGFRVGLGANGATIEFRDRNAASSPKPAIPDLKQLAKAGKSEGRKKRRW